MLTGDNNDNVIDGGDGDDLIEGRGGADTLNGGDGTDTASYESAPAITARTIPADDSNGLSSAVTGVTGVYVNLNLDTQVTGNSDASGDVLTSIENLFGSAHRDVLVGDEDANLIYGDAGADMLYGGAEDDTLIGGAGSDTLDGGAGTDRTSYAASAVAITLTPTSAFRLNSDVSALDLSAATNPNQISNTPCGDSEGRGCCGKNHSRASGYEPG